MVGCDTRCDASCSCTSVIYSDILTGSTLSDGKSPKCTCPHSAYHPPSNGPLQTTTCLPQPLPATPRREEMPREPDYLRLERTLISPGRIGPFEAPDPQSVYFTRKFPLYKAEEYNQAVDHVVRLRRYHKCAAEWLLPCDTTNRPFYSILFLQSAKQNPSALPIQEQPSVAIVAEKPPVIPEPVVEENIPKSVGPSDVSMCSNKWGSVYKAMGSASEASGGSQQTDSAERLVRIWQEEFVEKSWSTEPTAELTADKGVYDSGDVTQSIVASRTTREEDFEQWYRAIEQMDRLMEKTAESTSNLSCSTAATISVHQATTLTSSSCPLANSTTVSQSRPSVESPQRPKTIYYRIRKFLLGGPTQLINKKQISKRN